jgi:death on curing protein
MTEPVWVPATVVKAMHDAQLAEHGGAAGLRDHGLLESALARPRNLFAYGETDVCSLAAAYAAGIVKNHPFVDGNKRTAFLAGYVFLRRNGFDFEANEASTVAAVLALASGEATEAGFVNWLRDNAKPA